MLIDFPRIRSQWLAACLALILSQQLCGAEAPPAPMGLTCDLLSNIAPNDASQLAVSKLVLNSPQPFPAPMIQTATPVFGWIVTDPSQGAVQSAYQLLMAPTGTKLAVGEPGVWDSGQVESSQSINVRCQSLKLKPDTVYHWRVRTWDKAGNPSEYSQPHTFVTTGFDAPNSVSRHKLARTLVAPVEVRRTGDTSHFIDFGRAAFGTVHLKLTAETDQQQVVIRLGEVLSSNGTINRKPGGTRRYRRVAIKLNKGEHDYTVSFPPVKRNTSGAAIRLPAAIGRVMPFRYCEVEGYPYDLTSQDARQITIHYPFDNDASHFESSDKVLNQIWDLCKYSIKATTFAGVYVDGDRERIPYEADAYLNQLCHYCVDREYAIARHSHEYLIEHATWPTEWILTSVLMAWADYAYTGDSRSLERRYEDLRAKTLIALAREDGLISTLTGLLTRKVQRDAHYRGKALKDIVDWPRGERDGYDFHKINTNVNAFHYRAVVLMAHVADVLGKQQDAQLFTQRAGLIRQSMQQKLVDPKRKLFVDGEGSTHASLHANMMPATFGLLPKGFEAPVAAHLKSRGMACSVYGAQYLLDALYELGEADYALSLLTSTEERSWWNMIRDGSTITMEAWANRFKSNQDWNHAWGAVPANVIPRRLMGVRPLKPGFEKVLIEPQPGTLEYAKLKTPTIRGPVFVDYRRKSDDAFTLEVTLPGNTPGVLRLPKRMLEGKAIMLDGKPVAADSDSGAGEWEVSAGKHTVEVTAK